MHWFQQKRIYLDYAAATPVRKEVLNAMSQYWSQNYGNPGAIHREGVLADKAVDESREKVARTLRVRATDITFTSGGTESNNLAIRGLVKNIHESGVRFEDIEIISTKVEHPSISKVLEDLEKQGCVITFVSVNEDGLINISELGKLLSSKTRLVTVGYANSETGVVQDLGKISRTVRAYEKENGLAISFHTDAAQAPRWLPCALDALGVDMMSLDAGKCEGPKGVGILVARGKVKLSSVSFGGSQEEGLRPGTEPVSLVVGAAKALELAQAEYEKTSAKVSSLRDKWISLLLANNQITLNGSQEKRLPNNINISITGFDSEFAVISLDAAGIAASTKSACSGAGSGLSKVVYSMTSDEKRASSTIRFTLSPETSWGDLKKTTKVLNDFLDRMSEV